ncbi:MAG: hypothetical protein Q9166_003253 [cf. Caloplaca sp. 2 TL-2023]
MARSFISFGAGVVILSVAIDPFVQLTVGKRYALIYETDQSTHIVYAKRYSKGNFAPRLGQSAEQPQFITQQKYQSPPPDTLNYYTDSASLVRTDLQLGTGFNLSQTAVYGINKAMNETFSTRPDTNKGIKLPEFINAYILSREIVTYHPTVMQVLHDSPDLNATFAALAKSMTNSIRANSDDNLVMAGQAGIYYALIEVRWPYLILPAILVACGGAFLAIVIYHTHATGIAVWCSNVMPSVALGERLEALFTDNMLLSQMSEKAKQQAIDFSNLSSVTKPILTTGSHGNADYEMVPLDGASEGRRTVKRAISDILDMEPGVLGERQSQIDLV